MAEAIEALQADGIAVDPLLIRAFPFPESVRGSIDAHESVFVVEQNRDGQLRSLLVNEFGIDPARLVAVLHYAGTPITARFIAGAIGAPLGSAVPREQVARPTSPNQNPTTPHTAATPSASPAPTTRAQTTPNPRGA